MGLRTAPAGSDRVGRKLGKGELSWTSLPTRSAWGRRSTSYAHCTRTSSLITRRWPTLTSAARSGRSGCSTSGPSFRAERKEANRKDVRPGSNASSPVVQARRAIGELARRTHNPNREGDVHHERIRDNAHPQQD